MEFFFMRKERTMPRKIRIIRTDMTGHSAIESTTEEMATYDFDAHREAVVVNGDAVNTFEDFMRIIDAAPPKETPEVWMFPPTIGG